MGPFLRLKSGRGRPFCSMCWGVVRQDMHWIREGGCRREEGLPWEGCERGGS